MIHISCTLCTAHPSFIHLTPPSSTPLYYSFPASFVLPLFAFLYNSPFQYPSLLPLSSTLCTAPFLYPSILSTSYTSLLLISCTLCTAPFLYPSVLPPSYTSLLPLSSTICTAPFLYPSILILSCTPLYCPFYASFSISLYIYPFLYFSLLPLSCTLCTARFCVSICTLLPVHLFTSSFQYPLYCAFSVPLYTSPFLYISLLPVSCTFDTALPHSTTFYDTCVCRWIFLYNNIKDTIYTPKYVFLFMYYILK